MFHVAFENDGEPVCLVMGDADDAVAKAHELLHGHDDVERDIEEFDGDYEKYLADLHDYYQVKQVNADEALQIIKDRIENKNRICVLL